MAELDAKTVKAFHEAKPRTIYLDHELDRAAGREFAPAERSARMCEIARFLPSCLPYSTPGFLLNNISRVLIWKAGRQEQCRCGHGAGD